LPRGRNGAQKSSSAQIFREIFLPGTSRGNARCRLAISLGRFGVRLVCRRTSGCSSVELTRRMDCYATAGSRLPRSQALAVLSIRATSRKPMRVSAESTRALGGDSRKHLRGNKTKLVRRTVVLPRSFDSKRQRMFPLYKSARAKPPNLWSSDKASSEFDNLLGVRGCAGSSGHRCCFFWR
jgi:hypothetical protein